MNTTPPSMLDAALLYAEMGYPVFPCAPGSKRPLTGHGFKDATTDDDQIEQWWSAHPTANIAIPTQGMVVIDIDGEQNPWIVDEPEKLIDLAVAPQSRTGNGGRQCIFRQSAGKHYRNTTGSLAPHVDTRADGGYIVVPPSILAGGKQYTWVPEYGLDVGPELLPEPPSWLVAMLDALATGDPVGADASEGAYGSNIIPSGQRNATLARLAGAMRRVGMGQAEIVAALHATNATRCNPPLPDQEVERIAASIARYEPDTVATALVENHYEQDRPHPRSSEGSDDTLPGGDESGNPGAFPEHLLQVPGFVGELAEHTLRTAPYPQPILAFAGALSAQAFLAGRRVRDASDSRTNLYVLALANSGAGLAPTLTRIADTFTRVTVSVNTWIKQNRRWVVQVLKVAAAVVAAGAALVVLGTLVSGLGAAFGVLASIITGVGAAFGVLAGAIVFLVSPIGLVIAALALLGTYLVQTTDIAGQALDWLGDRFNMLKDTALRAYQGIADALAAGDIALAAKVLWLTLKMEWTKGVNYLKSLWLNFRGFMADVLVGAFTGALAALETVWHGLEVAWIETTAFFATAWHGFVNIFLRSWERMKALATKTWNWIKGLFSDSIDVSAANAEIDRVLEDRLAEIDQSTGEAVIGADLRRQTRRDRAASIHEQTLGVIGQRYEDEQNRQARQRAEAEAEAERALIAARREWEEAIAEAKQQRSANNADDAPGLPTTLELPDLSGIGDMLEREAARIGSIGSFNPAAMLGLALSSDATERTADAAEETARNTKRIEREIKTGNLAFT